MEYDIDYFLVTNPGGYSITVIPNDKLESNGLAIVQTDRSTEGIQLGGVFNPNQSEIVSTPETGDSTQVGVWTILAGLSTRLVMYFRKKEEEV